MASAANLGSSVTSDTTTPTRTSIDELGRLLDYKQGKWYAATSTVGTGNEQTAGKSWQLDEVGNWKTHDDHKDARGAFSPTYDAVNFYTVWPAEVENNPDGTVSLTMESDIARGFLYRRQEQPNSFLLYKHDPLGRLIEVSREIVSPSQTITSLSQYGYHADGRLAWRQEGSGPREWVIYDSNQPIVQDKLTTPVQRSWTFVWSGTTLVKATSAGGVETFAHQDRLGSIVLQTKKSGSTVQTHGHAVYDPYGRAATVPSWGPNNVDLPFGYAGARREDAVGLYLMGARWYDPVLGRFIEQDPIGEAGGANIYAYTGSSPVSWVDPSGLCPKGYPFSPLGSYFDRARLEGKSVFQIADEYEQVSREMIVAFNRNPFGLGDDIRNLPEQRELAQELTLLYLRIGAGPGAAQIVTLSELLELF